MLNTGTVVYIIPKWCCILPYCSCLYLTRLGVLAVSKLIWDCQDEQKSWMLSLCHGRLCFSPTFVSSLVHFSRHCIRLLPCPLAASLCRWQLLPSLPIMLDEQVAPCRWWANPYKDFTSLRNPFNVASRLINRPNWNHSLCQALCSDLTRGRSTVSVVCLHKTISKFCGGQIVELIQHMLNWMKSFALHLTWLRRKFPGYNLLKGLLLVPEF